MKHVNKEVSSKEELVPILVGIMAGILGAFIQHYLKLEKLENEFREKYGLKY